eukprot:CAMPEP_0183308832 /NCGR_PEP_ID=MMETSP0160_2-20130417/22556_1 /TAXON_ID=2839 ORGANISM="Odontella Sinensis, Strain Grunow 1884" /NCGR_SAMPLE_ID=MMETSP0160_2 /ASSEMBLY_ACC=CAM_ASM_000250 /LENGTH=324 /DNA_ID=CAMNT_0025472733 /DNA_START=30 /DNA_END=1001 /DNA_ORIENTATION=-
MTVVTDDASGGCATAKTSASTSSMSTLTETSVGRTDEMNEEVRSNDSADLLRPNLSAETPLFDEEVELEGCRKVLESLTKEEREGLADRNMILRHFRAEKGDVNSAIQKIKSTIAWRKDFEVDKIMSCFDHNDEHRDGHDNDDMDKMRQIIEEENATGKAYVRGYDKQGRAILYLKPARENTKNETNQMRHLVYQLERAIAATARIGGGKEKVNIIIDYKGYKLRNAPPPSTSRYTLDILQRHYCERMHRSYICNPPFVFKAFWAFIKPFLDPVTKEKIVFCHGEGGEKIMESDFDLEIMEECAGGTKQIRAFDSKEYLYSPLD